MAFSWQQGTPKETKPETNGFSWHSSTPEQIQQRADIQSAQIESNRLENRSLFSRVVDTFRPENALPNIANAESAFFSGAKAGFNEPKYASLNPKDAYSNIQKSTEEAKNQFVQTITDTGARINKAFDTWSGNTTALEKGIDTGSAVLGVINTVFLPATTVLKTLTGAPIIGPAATTIEKIFGAVGNGTASYATYILDNSSLSDEDKARLRPVVSESASLIGMMLAGKAGHSTTVATKTKIGELVDAVKSIDVQKTLGAIDVVPGVGTNPIRQLKVQDVAKPESTFVPEPPQYGKYTPDDRLPTIDFGGETGKITDLPVPEGMTIEPDFSWEKPVEIPEAPKTFGVQIEPGAGPKYSGDTFQSKTSLKLSNEAKKVGVEGEVRYQQKRNNAVDDQRAAEFFENNKEEAMNMLEGDKEIPTNEFLWGNLFKAAKKSLLKNPDPDMLIRLQNTTEQSLTAQTLQSLREYNDYTADAVAAAREISRARADAVKETTLNEAKRIKIPPVTKESFAEFIQKIDIC